MSSPWSPTFEPLFVLLGIGALWGYVRAARTDPPGAGRAIAFSGGVVMIVLALNSPLETIAVEYLVLFHLLQNVIISDWAPPLLLLGLTPAMRSSIAARGGRPFAASRARPSRSPSGSSGGTSSTSAASTTRRCDNRCC